MPRFLAVDIERHYREGLLAAEQLSSKGSTRYDTLYHPARFSFNHLVRQDAPDIVKVDGFDFDVGKESVLIEQRCTSSTMGHVEPIREKLVVNVLNRLLQGNDVPFPFDLLLDSAFSSTSMLSLFCPNERLGTLLSK